MPRPEATPRATLSPLRHQGRGQPGSRAEGSLRGYRLADCYAPPMAGLQLGLQVRLALQTPRVNPNTVTSTRRGTEVGYGTESSQGAVPRGGRAQASPGEPATAALPFHRTFQGAPKFKL